MIDEPVAIITGAARGMGRRTAELLAGRGYAIAIIDLRDPVSTTQAIEAAGGQVLANSGDITREETVADFARQVFARYGRADVLVTTPASASSRPPKTLPSLTTGACSR
jgi:NAD(P)-dependent dehydrogenase (short-subunit alcohol dehydrogenase family)